MGSLIFGANHFIPLDFVWSAAMVGFGAILLDHLVGERE
jgi:hypothetical protein